MSILVGCGDLSLNNGASSSSSRSMSSLEVMGAGVLAFFFTLHSYIIKITDRMSLKCSSLFFLAASSLIFCTLIRWIFLLWLDVRPGGHQRGAGAVPDTVVLEGFFCPEAKETGWSDLGNQNVRFAGHHELVPASILVSAFTFGTLFCFAATSSGLFSVSVFASPLAEDLLLSPVLP
jgi:hypothetical protein